jgi:hypothetical protein
MEVTNSKLDSYIDALVDAKLLLQIPEFEPFRTSVWVPFPNAKYGEEHGRYDYIDNEADPDTEEGKKHYHWIYKVPEEASE